MPPKHTARGSNRGRGRGRGRPPTSKTTPVPEDEESSDPFDESDDHGGHRDDATHGQSSSTTRHDTEYEKSIPRDLLTRVLHEFFAKDATRISRDANGAAAKYVDVFVREAIARAAVEKKGGFLEVEDLEKIAPQLLLDL